MKRIVTGCAVIGLGLVLAATHAEAQDLQQKVAAAKQTAAQNQQALLGYTWVEKTEVAMKGEVKSSSVTVRRMRLASPWTAEAAFKKKAAE